MSDLVGNPKDRFSHNEAQMLGLGQIVVVVVSIAKAIARQDLGFKSYSRDLRNPGLNSRPLVYR